MLFLSIRNRLFRPIILISVQNFHVWWCVFNLQTEIYRFKVFRKCLSLLLSCCYHHWYTVRHHLCSFQIVILGWQHRSSFRETPLNIDWCDSHHRWKTCMCKLTSLEWTLGHFSSDFCPKLLTAFFWSLTLIFIISFIICQKQICWIHDNDNVACTCGHACSYTKLLSVNTQSLVLLRLINQLNGRWRPLREPCAPC